MTRSRFEVFRDLETVAKMESELLDEAEAYVESAVASSKADTYSMYAHIVLR